MNHQTNPDVDDMPLPSHRENSGQAQSKTPLKARDYLLGHRMGKEIVQGARRDQDD